ncbi:hypothetical protein [Streptomyces sp. NPDC003077]|uniref:hypothetical protein n=1 Tax=Streptomyces sp. NPDC003077 TaxID=3154443 RepID=UPI0033B55567
MAAVLRTGTVLLAGWLLTLCGTDLASTLQSETRPPEASDATLTRLLALAAGPLLVLTATFLLLRRRSRLRDLAAPFALPRSVFAAARQADAAALREQAAEEVARLAQEARAPHTEPARAQSALASCSTAETVLGQARGIPDLAGVFALVSEGRAALARTPDALPLCFFHPLHGPALRRVPWRPSADRDHIRVAACDGCLRALRGRRTPQVLVDRLDGAEVPYYTVPPERSLWSATGYGSLLTGESLTTRIRREGLTHGRR